MREPIENISLLQKQINNLQLENQILKSILDRSGISYTHEIARIGEPEKQKDTIRTKAHGSFIQDR